MKIFDPMHADERPARRQTGGSEGESVGPQGAALILELQRLRQAFERENLHDANPPQPRRAAHDGQRAPGRRPARPKRRRKGKMGRVLDAWLGPFGFQADGPQADGPHADGPDANGTRAEAPVRRSGPSSRPPDYASLFVRLALEHSGLAEPIAVCAVVRPPWLAAVAGEVGVATCTVAEALALYQP